MEEQKKPEHKPEHKYNYAADIRAWERKHGPHKFVLNPPPIPKWMISKKGERE